MTYTQERRAWATYEGWLLYWQSIGKMESVWLIPTEPNGLAMNMEVPLMEAIEYGSLYIGDLQSIRVTFENREEMKLEAPYASGYAGYWSWEVSVGGKLVATNVMKASTDRLLVGMAIVHARDFLDEYRKKVA